VAATGTTSPASGEPAEWIPSACPVFSNSFVSSDVPPEKYSPAPAPRRTAASPNRRNDGITHRSRLQSPVRHSETRMTRRSPNRSARTPLGNCMSAKAIHIPVRTTPISVFETPKVSTMSGTRGLMTSRAPTWLKFATTANVRTLYRYDVTRTTSPYTGVDSAGWAADGHIPQDDRSSTQCSEVGAGLGSHGQRPSARSPAS
jgi:hypothetical protein